MEQAGCAGHNRRTRRQGEAKDIMDGDRWHTIGTPVLKASRISQLLYQKMLDVL